MWLVRRSEKNELSQLPDANDRLEVNAAMQLDKRQSIRRIGEEKVHSWNGTKADDAEQIKAVKDKGVERSITHTFSKIKSFISTAGLGFEFTVVIAGDGAEIQFLRDSIGEPLLVSGSELAFSSFRPVQPD